jgi:hypothetical protein
MQLIFLLVYAGLSLLVAYAGRHTRVGFLGLLIFSLLLTPLVTAVLTVLFGSKRRRSK